MTYFDAYLLVMLGDFKVVLAIVGAVFLSCSFITFLVSCDEDNPKILKKTIFIGSLILLMAFLVPTTKQLAAIYFVPTIYNNEQVKELPEKLLKLGNEWIDELSPSK